VLLVSVFLPSLFGGLRVRGLLLELLKDLVLADLALRLGMIRHWH